MSIPLVFEPWVVKNLPRDPKNNKSWADVNYDSGSYGIPDKASVWCRFERTCDGWSLMNCKEQSVVSLSLDPNTSRYSFKTEVCCPTFPSACSMRNQVHEFTAQPLVWD